jgi:hypothetical protein
VAGRVEEATTAGGAGMLPGAGHETGTDLTGGVDVAWMGSARIG